MGIVGSSAVVLPPAFGTRVVASLCDTSYEALVLNGGCSRPEGRCIDPLVVKGCGTPPGRDDHLLVASVYLPDSSKSDHVFESAVEGLVTCLRIARAEHGVRRFILVGDWNVSISAAAQDVDAALKQVVR